jgi:MSHA biogenesis protein MshJ
MSQAKALLTALLEQFGQRSRREQFLLLAVLFAVIIAPWYSFVADPLLVKMHTLQEQIVSTREKNSQLKVQSSEVMVRNQADPDLENHRRLEQLHAEIQQSDLRLQQMTLGLIPPKEMAQVLEKVLQRESGLRFLKLENIPAVAMVPAGSSTVGAEAAPPGVPLLRLYQHGLRLEFEGSYLEAIAYLRQLEGLPYRFIWDELEIEVQDYPKARIVITVHTLSLQKGWIGV